MNKVTYVGDNQDVPTGYWEDVTVKDWTNGSTTPGEWVDGYTEPRVWVEGYYVYYWWWSHRYRYWVAGEWKDGETVEGYWTEPTTVEGYWTEKTERQWIDNNVVINEDPGVTDNLVSSGTNRTASTSYPPPLECSADDHVADSHYPIISYSKKYGKNS